MSHRRNHDWEGELAGGIVGSIIIVALVVAAVVITLLVVLVTELWRVYKARAWQSTTSSRALWGALAALLGVWLFAGLLAFNSDTLPIGAYLAAWSFLAFVITVEVIDWRERRAEPQPTIPANISLADVVSWQPTGTAAHPTPLSAPQPVGASSRANGQAVKRTAA